VLLRKKEQVQKCRKCGSVFDISETCPICNSPANEMTDAQTRVCTGCGRQIPTENNFCPFCGRPRYPQQPYYSPSTQPYPQQQYSEPVGELKYALYFLSLTSVMVGVIIFLIWKNDPSPEKRLIGKNCLIFSVVSFVLFTFIAATILYLSWAPLLGIRLFSIS
jgi:RNA polymerase subunit RPABC4/transcription elongation factor Spt4